VAKTTDTIVEIYALVDGKKIEIEDLHYTITRETEPIYQLGSPMHKFMTAGRRTLTGSLSVNGASFRKLRVRRFDIHINIFEDNRTVLIKGVEMLNWMHPSDEDKYSVTFVAHGVDKE
jgi:hypothetical protein